MKIIEEKLKCKGFRHITFQTYIQTPISAMVFNKVVDVLPTPIIRATTFPFVIIERIQHERDIIPIN